MKIAVVCVLAMLGTCGMCDTMYWQISNVSGDVTYAFANGLDRRQFVSVSSAYMYGCHPENVASVYEEETECGFIDNMNLLVETMKTSSEGGSDLAMERCFGATVVVPEPSASVLCIIGLGMLMLRRKTFKWENG